jgi:hypothetical protein
LSVLDISQIGSGTLIGVSADFEVRKTLYLRGGALIIENQGLVSTLTLGAKFWRVSGLH